MPLIMDFEYNGNDCILAKANLTNKQRTNVCDTFLSYIKNSGYTPLLYANYSMLSDDLNSASLSNKYMIWIARYNTETGYSGDYDFWQYSDRGSVSGISGNVDMNFWYNDGSLSSDVVNAKSVTISSESETITAGKSIKLTAGMMPEDTTETYRWTSTNPQVAYVSSEGRVTGVSCGKTVIKVTTSSGLTAKCKVVVNKNIKDYKVVLGNKEAKYTYTGNVVKPKYTVRSKVKIASRGKAKEAVYLRTGPSLEYTAVECLKKGKKVYLYGYKKVDGVKWYAAKCKISGNWCKGYICGTYLKITSKKYDKLTKNTDFTGKYIDNTDIGVAKISLSGLGKVSGIKTKKFTIGPRKVSDIKVTKKNSSYIEFSFQADNEIDGYVLYKASSKDGVYKKCKVINTEGVEVDETESDETPSDASEVTLEDGSVLENVSEEIVEYKAASVDDTANDDEVVSTSCKDTGVKKGHEYYYKVYSYRYVNGEMITSPASKVVTANCKFIKKVYAKVKLACNVRKGAGVNYKTVKVVAKGEKFRVLAITHDSNGKAWVKIRYTNKSGKKKTGYILKSLVKLS